MLSSTTDQATSAGLPPRIAAASPEKVKALAQQLEGVEYEPGQLLVRFHSPVDVGADYGAKVVERFDLPGLVRLEVPAGIELAEALVALRDDPRVAYAEPNHLAHLADQPNDLIPQLWNLDNQGQSGGTPGADISALEAWKVSAGDRQTAPLVAIIDTGVDYNHPDLQANIWKNPGEIPGDGIDNDNNGVIDDYHGFNAIDEDGDPQDVHSHGTHVAGIIAAEGNNHQGVVGVAWQARLMPIRVFNEHGVASAATILRGILYAARMGAEVTNNSWTSVLPNEAVKDAFASWDALHICAAGNNNYFTDRQPTYPMGYELPNIVSVGATDHNDQRSTFSNYGPKSVDVMAPGTDIFSTLPGGNYGRMSGTSMATPHVTGLVSLIKGAHPGISNQQVLDRLRFSSDPAEALAETSGSGGRINAARAIEEDTEAPAAPNDFRAVEARSRRVDLGWTASADDGWCNGPAVGYEVHLSERPLEQLDASNLVNQGKLEATGQLESISLPFAVDDQHDRTYYAAMQMVDNVGNRSQARTTSFVIPAARTHLADDFDGELKGWTAEGSWQKAAVEGRGMVWKSNQDHYDNNLSMSLVSPAIDLSQARGSLLTYEASYSLALGDVGFVEVSDDGGQSWTSVRSMNRLSGDWRYYEVDLSRFDGKQVQVRFRLRSNDEEGDTGIMLDNFRLLSDRTS
ncbi:MAG: S8 family serine peptidase [Candidatus Eremiobacteraeota bacterium]|nr:S8 family serine peptidase [Candidatus Eremiobacteraeota bacterium]